MARWKEIMGTGIESWVVISWKNGSREVPCIHGDLSYDCNAQGGNASRLAKGGNQKIPYFFRPCFLR